MARTNNLTNFLNDVSSAIKQKTGDSTPIPASEFDTEILSIETAGTYQTKSVTITENTTTTIIPDTGYDAIEQLTITTNVPMSQLQSKSVTITSNGNIAVLPDTNYDGMTQVNLNVNVPTSSEGIQEFTSEQAMREAGLQEGDKAIVYNSTDKLIGYYNAISEDMVRFPLVNNYTISDNNITYDFTNCKTVNKQKLIRIMHKLCSELEWDYYFGWGGVIENATVVYRNGKWYAYASWFNATSPTTRKQHYNIPMMIKSDSSSVMCYDNPTADTPSQRLEYCELDLENETYEYLGIPTYDSIVSYNSVTSSSTTPFQSIRFTLSNNDTVALAYFKNANGPYFQLPSIFKNISEGDNVSSNAPKYTRTQTSITAMDTTEIVPSLLDTGLIYGTQDADATANDISKDKIAYSQGNKLIGTLNGTKLFETQAEMQADPTAQEGDLAVVYRNETTIPSPGDTINSFSPPATVVFDTPITSSSTLMLRGGMLMLRCTLSATSYIMVDQMGTVMHDRIQYTSNDGITYTRTDGGAESYDLGAEVTISSTANTNILKFLSTGGMVFEGLYQYNTDQYAIAKSQLNATSDYVYGKTFYGKNGAETGVLQSGVISDTNTKNIFIDIANKFETGLVVNDGIKFQNLTFSKLPFNLDTSNVTNMYQMFNYCSNLTEIPLLDTSNVTNMDHMLYNCTNLTTVPQLDTANVTNMYDMFGYCSTLTTIPQLDTSNVTSMSYMFTNCTNLTTVPQLDTSNVTTMLGMFNYCSNLTTIPLLNTSNVTTMLGMFNYCSNLTTIPLLNTGNVTSMNGMFYNCTNLATMPQLDTSNVTDMSSMFGYCTNLTEIPQLDTNNVTSMASMFYNCTNLATVPQLNMSNVTSMSDMFDYCTSLSNVSLNNILAMCTNATKITSNKTLKVVGLTETQANTCKTLSNYSAFTAAGWTTGY